MTRLHKPDRQGITTTLYSARCEVLRLQGNVTIYNCLLALLAWTGDGCIISSCQSAANSAIVKHLLVMSLTYVSMSADGQQQNPQFDKRGCSISLGLTTQSLTRQHNECSTVSQLQLPPAGDRLNESTYMSTR